MKKTLLICGALLAFAVPAFAQHQPGIDLHWNDCFLAGGALDATTLCTTNTGSLLMVASFVPHTTLPLYEANLCIIDLQTNQAALSPWWHMESGGCPTRVGKVNCDANFTGAPFNAGICGDFWGGGATPALLYSPSTIIPFNSVRTKAVAGVAENFAGLVDNSQVWYSLKVSILKTGTVGACNVGCTDAACIVLNETRLSQPAPVPDDVITNPIPEPGASQYITYRGGTGTQLCPGATPTQQKTWGQLKSLYR